MDLKGPKLIFTCNKSNHVPSYQYSHIVKSKVRHYGLVNPDKAYIIYPLPKYLDLYCMLPRGICYLRSTARQQCTLPRRLAKHDVQNRQFSGIVTLRSLLRHTWLVFHALSLYYLKSCVSYSATAVWIVPPENGTDRLACAYLWGVLY